MKRRLALTFAGSAAIVLTAGSAAVAANLGILGAASEEPVGKLDANTVAELSAPITSVDPVVVTVDEIVPVPVESVPPAPSPTGIGDDDTARPASTTSSVTPTTVRGEDRSRTDDDHGDDHDDDRGHGEDDEIEYEDD